MNADAFTTAARAEAEERWPHGPNRSQPLSHRERMDRRAGFDLGAQWARDRLAAHSDLTVYSEPVTVESDEPTEAEVRTIAQHLAHAALDWTDDEIGEHTHEPSCANWEPYSAEAHAALTDAKGARA